MLTDTDKNDEYKCIRFEYFWNAFTDSQTQLKFLSNIMLFQEKRKIFFFIKCQKKIKTFLHRKSSISLMSKRSVKLFLFCFLRHNNNKKICENAFSRNITRKGIFTTEKPLHKLALNNHIFWELSKTEINKSFSEALVLNLNSNSNFSLLITISQ